MRKHNYQEELEQKYEQLKKLTRELNDQNSGLIAQNSLLKKQISYFEDVFAKSQLIGFDTLNRNELEEFKRSLLTKLNATFADQKHDSVMEEPAIVSRSSP